MKSIALRVSIPASRGAMQAKGCALLRWFVGLADFMPNVASFLLRSEQVLEDVPRVRRHFRSLHSKKASVLTASC